jgi:hypothetical protein
VTVARPPHVRLSRSRRQAELVIKGDEVPPHAGVWVRKGGEDE